MARKPKRSRGRGRGREGASPAARRNPSRTIALAALAILAGAGLFAKLYGSGFFSGDSDNGLRKAGDSGLLLVREFSDYG